MRVTTGAIALMAVVGCAVAVTASQGLFRARVNLVRLQVLVTEDGQPVLGLEPRDFEVTDNGVRQRIETVYAERLPLDLLFVMDRSASMAGEPLARLKGAAQELLSSLRPDDRCGLLSFSHWVSLDVDLTHDRSRMARAVEGLSADGLTSVLDALYGSLHVGLEPDRRMLVLLFSDGLDSHSWMTADDVTALARQSEAVIGAVAFKPGPARRGEESEAAPPNVPFLRSLAEDTGGEIVLATRPDEFSSAFARLLARARSRYLISYYPQGPERAGWHEVKIRLRSGHGAVLARRGYDVPPGEVR